MSLAANPGLDSSIDCDVHCAAPTIGMLTPYLTEHWRAFFAHKSLEQLPAVERTYPSAVRGMATRSEDTSLARIRSTVLSRSTYALLNCYTGVESVRHPFLAGTVASAINMWLAEEWLSRE